MILVPAERSCCSYFTFQRGQVSSVPTTDLCRLYTTPITLDCNFHEPSISYDLKLGGTADFEHVVLDVPRPSRRSSPPEMLNLKQPAL
jgi:hypothetical protein